MKNMWEFLSDEHFMSETSGLAKLWETIVSPLVGSGYFFDDDFKQAFAMLKDISEAKTGAGSGIISHRLTGKALRIQNVIQSFREKQTPTAEAQQPQELHAFNEAEKHAVLKSTALSDNLTEAERKAVAWYDNVEKALQGLIKRIQYDTSGAFVGGDEALFMRRMVGAGGLMAITSPSIPVKQNVLMTMLGVLVAENSLKEVFDDYTKVEGNETKTFVQFVEEVVQPQNRMWFRKVLNKIDKRLSAKQGTGFLIGGAEYSQTRPKTREETTLTELLKEQNPRKKDVFKAINPLLDSDTNEPINVKFKLNPNQETNVTINNSFIANLRKGVLLYLDALATPALGDVDPVTKEPTVQAKWTYEEFMRFYSDTENAIRKTKQTMTPKAGQQLEDLGRAFIQREKQLRFGDVPSEEAKSMMTAPVGAQTTFGNAVRDYYVTHFGSEATKVKSFGLSVVFKTLADKLGFGSSVLPSVVYDVWMNANVHNLLREAETGINNTGQPNENRIKALQQKYRQALLPYGFDVAFDFDENTKRVNVTVKDFDTGQIYKRKQRRFDVSDMIDDDLATFNAINTAPDTHPLSQIRKEWKQKRMFFASEKTEGVQEKASRLTNLTKVFLRRFGEEWHSVFQAGDEPPATLVLKELEKAVNHFMNVRYDQNGDVYVLPTHPFYQKVQSLKKNTNLQTLFDGTKEIAVETIFQNGKEEITVGIDKRKNQPKKRMLWDLYKENIDSLREGGVPMAFAEEIMKNAMYVDPTKPMEPRKLQALLWVCSRGAV